MEAACKASLIIAELARGLKSSFWQHEFDVALLLWIFNRHLLERERVSRRSPNSETKLKNGNNSLIHVQVEKFVKT